MHEPELRMLDASEVSAARDLCSANPDIHARYIVERQPVFFDIARLFDPDDRFFNRQRLVVGAFVQDQLIGTVAVETTSAMTATDLPDNHEFWDRYGQHDLDLFTTLYESLTRTYIGAPNGALTIHSLSVALAHRRNGIASALLQCVINALTQDEKASLYIECARRRSLTMLGRSVGFACERKTFSFSERLEYGCWGSVLMRYAIPNCG